MQRMLPITAVKTVGWEALKTYAPHHNRQNSRPEGVKTYVPITAVKTFSRRGREPPDAKWRWTSSLHSR